MSREYIEHRDGGYWIAGSRVSLDSIVYAFLEGQTAENLDKDRIKKIGLDLLRRAEDQDA